jgi:nucleotide-binding universal stress UspA family protein
MYKHILVPVDLNDETSWQKTLPSALEMCRTFGATLHLMTVVPEIGLHAAVTQYFPSNYEEEIRRQVHDDLHAFSSHHVPAGTKVQHIIAYGKVYKEILDAAKMVKADLIVMGAHHPEFEDYLLGPNAARVVRHAGCSVMVVRN